MHIKQQNKKKQKEKRNMIFMSLVLFFTFSMLCYAIPTPTGIAGNIIGKGAGGASVKITAYETGTNIKLAIIETTAQGSQGDTFVRYAGAVSTSQTRNLDLFVSAEGNGYDTTGSNGVFNVRPGAEQTINVTLVKDTLPVVPLPPTEGAGSGRRGSRGGFAYQPDYLEDPNLTGINMSEMFEVRENPEELRDFLKEKTDDVLNKREELEKAREEKPAEPKLTYKPLIVLLAAIIIIISYYIIKKRRRKGLVYEGYE